jgi:hypothetical protein
MYKNLSLAACSHYVFTAFPYENLGEKGFSVDPERKNEKDGVVTQTLYVSSPSPTPTPPVALEFLEIVDEEEFMRSLRKQNQMPGQRGREILRPGLRFWGELDGSERDTSIELVGSIPVQVQSVKNNEEYSKQMDIENKKSNHPNSAKSIWGLYLGLSRMEREAWSHFLGRNPNEYNQWILDDGSRIQCATIGDGIYDYMEARKDFPFWAVIIQSEALSEVEKHFEFDKSFQWGGVRSLLIKEHLTDWDIIVI